MRTDSKTAPTKCNTPWGVGHYKLRLTDGSVVNCYGPHPRYMDPNGFWPDTKHCSDEQIDCWAEALDAWNSRETRRKEQMKWSIDRRARFLDLYNGGESVAAIARKMNLSQGRVRDVLKKAGVVFSKRV